MVLLLPVYRPDVRLLTLVGEARAALPEISVVVVDDGTEEQTILDAAEALGCTVLRHDANLGKGVAMKTGFRHIGDRDAVCADADGQHSVDDITRVWARLQECRGLVLGVREVGPEMPPRGRFGNTVTEALFRAATGLSVTDTQTGLRGFPGEWRDWLLAVPGERFEYEMNMLLRAAEEGLPIEQVRVATTYLDGNASSHFGAVSDAVRIYRPLLRSALRRATGRSGRPAGTGSESAATGSAATGSAATGSAATGSAATGSAEAGSVESGSMLGDQRPAS